MKTFREEAADIGNTAVGLISKDRAATHGHALVQHQIAAELWSAYLRGRKKLEVNLTGHEVAMLLLLLKASREAVGAHNRDNFVDAAGYSCLAGAIREFEEKDARVQEGREDRPAEVAQDRAAPPVAPWSGRDGNSDTAQRSQWGEWNGH